MICKLMAAAAAVATAAVTASAVTVMAAPAADSGHRVAVVAIAPPARPAPAVFAGPPWG
jgi:hypothetical protein